MHVSRCRSDQLVPRLSHPVRYVQREVRAGRAGVTPAVGLSCGGDAGSESWTGSCRSGWPSASGPSGSAGTAVLLALGLTAQWMLAAAIFVFLLGAVSQATTPTIQARIMGVAGDNQAIAGALSHSALNVGNSLGAILGGVVIAFGLGFAATAWVGALLAAGGLLLAIISLAIERRDRPQRVLEASPRCLMSQWPVADMLTGMAHHVPAS